MDAEIRPQAIESRGGSVESAIEAGLARLELDRDEVDIEILDEGNRGILGIGSRDAVVRLTARTAVPSTAPPPSASPSPTLRREEAPIVEGQADEGEALPFPDAPIPQPSAAIPSTRDKERFEEEEETDTTEEEPAVFLEQERDAAVAILTELLEKMQVRATVAARLSEPDEMSGRRVNMLDVTGEDLGVLIGPRGDTLDALQYVARLMVAHRLHRRTNFLVDVEGYRERREQALMRLAERMADKVRQRQEPISLEPMPPYERRIIHMTLRNASGVYTESTGEGDRRKVRIYPE
jgi:spoIIIJ-associated protein